jgi:pyrophosphatase PpaX
MKLGDLDKKTHAGLMDSMGVEVKAMRIKPLGPVGLKKREIVMHAGIDYLESKGYLDLEPVFLDAFKEVDKMSLSRLDQIIKPLPGVYELFKALKSSDCRIALATTDLKTRAIKAMQHLNLMGFIDDISGADDVLKPKPDPEMIYLICDKLGIRPDRAIMVGDAESDIKAGQNAGCLASIGVDSGLTCEAG